MSAPVTERHLETARALTFTHCQAEQVAQALADAEARGRNQAAPGRSRQLLAAELHEAWEFQYDECQHGTYHGGASNGEPYAMCELFAEYIIRRRVIPEPTPDRLSVAREAVARWIGQFTSPRSLDRWMPYELTDAADELLALPELRALFGGE